MKKRFLLNLTSIICFVPARFENGTISTLSQGRGQGEGDRDTSHPTCSTRQAPANHSLLHGIISLLLVVSGIAMPPSLSLASDAPVPYLTAEEELKTIQLQPGYHLELVVGDPIIKEPVQAVFDANGRMFVSEMRSYMQDIDATNELASISRVSLHWSSKNDGNLDQHTVFIDGLKLPRMLLPMDDGLLVNETDSNDLWLYRDTNGDGISDKKTLFYAGGPRGGNLEHQQSGLIWGIDNWMYMAVNSIRLRVQGTNVIQEQTPPNGGQWGISQDDYGKPWFVNAGGEIGPLNFQVPIIYGAFRVKDQFAPGFAEVYPLVGLADVQGGPIRFREDDKTLNHFTATCGNENVRGNRLPADLRGDLLFCEPVGRLIRRAKVEVIDGITFLRNPYEKSEFIRSTDPNFRPVNIANAPDGTLYIVDMYRGIIQEGNWTKEGSYLRGAIQKHGLDKNFGRGRIWRLVHDDFKPSAAPQMQNETPYQLVAHLEHPNGWWRDTAQRLLILRDTQSVTPALTQMARSSTNHLSRFHAIWTLEGLNALEPALVREKLKDQHPQVRIAAIRASESLYKKGNKSLVPNVLSLTNDPDPGVVLQVLMTANLLKWPDAESLISSTTTASSSRGVKEIAIQMIESTPVASREFTASERKVIDEGERIYKELCFACHGPDGKGTPMQGAKAGITMAPPIAGSKTVRGYPDGLISVLLKGLSGPVNGKTYDAQMVGMESNDDAWISAITSYVRNNFGNSSSLIYTSDVARVRASLKGRTEPWTLEELQASLPQRLTNRKEWKLTASHHPQGAYKATDGKMNTRYDTTTIQVPGMWFQIELPEETTIGGLELDAGSSVNDFPRGYIVELSNDGKTWGQPVTTGAGVQPLTEILFPPTKAKFIRITQTSRTDHWFWSIHELQIFKPAEPLKKSVTAQKQPATSSFE